MMCVPARLRDGLKSFGLLIAVATVAAPGQAQAAPDARLVHCGQDTCLRISGRRANAEVAIRIGGHELAAQGERNWRITVPLAIARGWMMPSGDALELTLVDPRNNTTSLQKSVLPPGALGRRVELVTLVVSAR
jgi:hypothetical protein